MEDMFLEIKEDINQLQVNHSEELKEKTIKKMESLSLLLDDFNM